MARVTILCIGSRGDVQPYVALGQRLALEGWDVTIGTHAPFRAVVERCRLSFAELPGDPREVIQSEHGQELLGLGRSTVRFVRRFAELLEPWWQALVEAATPLCEDAELIIYSPLGFVGWHLGEANDIPTVLAALQPFAPTAAFPSVTAGGRHFGSWGNRASHRVAEQVAWQTVRRLVDGWRAETLGLDRLGMGGPRPLLEARREPHLFGFSRHVVPVPADWRPEQHVTGYWFIHSEDDRLSPDLNAFLAAGEPPVYVGFGSMATDDAERAGAIVRDVADRLRTRLVVSSGWGGLETIDHDEIHVVSDAPHHLLFPEMRAVIHHGGAGTTGTAFQAGVPQMAVPFFADQPFWGHRIAALGAGPRPLPRRDLDVNAFASAVEVLISDRYRARARELGDLIFAEDGTAEAARFVGGLAPR